MKTFSKRRIFHHMALLSILPPISTTHGLSPCHGCVPEYLLRAEAYGVDIATDMSSAVQHANGTLEPVAMTNSSHQYRLLMRKYLSESEIHPYGYGHEMPRDFQNGSNDELEDAEVLVLYEEVNKLATLLERQERTIVHYGVSMPSFFTPSNQKHLSEAFKRSIFPDPQWFEPADIAAFTSLNTTHCLRHFEFNCVPIDYNPKTIIFLEYSDSKLSGTLLWFWGGWYFERVAYFVDALLGDESNGASAHWEMVTQRIQALIEDHKDKITFERDPLEIVMLGLRGSDPSFHQAVQDALRLAANGHVLHPSTLQTTVLDPIFVSAFGTARGTKSVIDCPQPAGCNVEENKCRLMRERVLHDSLVEQQPKDRHSGEL